MSIRSLFPTLALILGAASPALATPSDGWFSFGKRTRYGDVSVQFGGRQHVGARHDRAKAYGAHRHGSSCRYTPGHWEQVRRDVWVPGTRRQVWVEPVHDTWYDSCGTPRQRLVRAGYWEWITEGGCFQPRYEKVWRPARYECSSIVRRY